MSSSPSYLLERSNDYVTMRNYASFHFAKRTILGLTKIISHLSGGCVEGGSDFPFLCFHITPSLNLGISILWRVSVSSFYSVTGI